jgi:hypothetical protein
VIAETGADDLQQAFARLVAATPSRDASGQEQAA